ncbi:unnamed protein product [Fraxinus pennsylvanica]|uniref:SHSP domain-containing protein n=1 Tax=Fraxinus pennsylvanica TaxID=56036 RepID=A0AAD1ZU03_9LAMI|nr:unnamed protein product [Fraxinus pennsylvanica]
MLAMQWRSVREMSYVSTNCARRLMMVLFHSSLQFPYGLTHKIIGSCSDAFDPFFHTGDGICQVDMPGLDKDDQVKVSVEQNTMVIQGKGEKEFESEEYTRKIIGSCSDAFDPFFPTGSLSQVLKMMDNPFMSTGCGKGVGAEISRGWDLPSRHAWT